MKHIKFLIAATMVLLAAGLSAQQPQPPILRNFTNAATGASGFHATNTLIVITNTGGGTTSLTITSAPVAMFRGRGVGLWAAFSATNAILTNINLVFDFSPDGTNFSTALPQVNWLITGIAGATSKYVQGTNLTADFCDNWRYIRLKSLTVTNIATNIGNIFLTNNGPTVAYEVFP